MAAMPQGGSLHPSPPNPQRGVPLHPASLSTKKELALWNCVNGVPLSHSDLTEFFHDNLPKVDSSLIFLPITLMPKSQLLCTGAK